MNAKSQNVHSQIEGLATLLVLDDETRKLNSLREFGFFVTNETHRLIPYHTAYLWQKSDIFSFNLLAQSGTAEIERSAPVNQWLKRKIAELSVYPDATSVFQTELVPLSEESNGAAAVWQESLPSNILWCPLLNRSNELTGGLIFFRETPFPENEIKMLRWLISTYQYTWLMLTKQNKTSFWKKIREKKIVVTISLIIVAILAMPVHLSVLSSATIVPLDPVLINAPMQGVIQSFSVKPGDAVKAGQILLSLDKTDLLSEKRVSEREYQLTQSKLRTAINAEFNQKTNTDQSSAEIPVLQAQLEVDRAHIEYTKTLLAKTDIKSPIDGIVVFDSKEDWIGQPVQTGERILTVSNPHKVQLRIFMPVTNAIQLDVGANGDFFLYGQLKSIPVRVTSLGYNARLTPNKILAYQIEAEFINPTDKLQLGAEGTVKLYGHRVPLIYYLLKRPLQALRQTVGI